MTDRIMPNESLRLGQFIESPDKHARLILQPDGNLVLYDMSNHSPLWATGTNNKGGAQAIMQPDGNFILYDSSHHPLWTSGTNGSDGAFVKVQNDGNLVVYKGTSSKWASDTDKYVKGDQSGGRHKRTTSPFDDAWGAVQSGVGTVGGLADTFKIPGANFYTALLTGKDPIAALKKDMSNFTDSAAIAKGIASGDMTAVKAAISSGAAKYGIQLPPEALNIAAAAAKSGDMKGAAAAAMGPGYSSAWQVATNNGTLYDPNLPAPQGMTYKPGAVPATSTPLDSHPTIVAANRVPLSQALSSSPLKNDLHPEVKAMVIAATGISPSLLAPKKKPWWAYGAGGGAAVGFAVAGPVGAALGAAIGGVGAHVALGQK